MFFSIVNQQLTRPWNPKQPAFNGCLVIPTIFQLKIWNHPIEKPLNNWLFRVPGTTADFTVRACEAARKKDAQECSMSVYRMKYGIIMIMV